MLRRFLPLLLATLVALIGVTPAHADQSPPAAGWLLIPQQIVLDTVVRADHMFMAPGASTTHQWYADDVALADETQVDLEITPDLIGKRIHATSVVSFPGHDPVSVESDTSDPVLSRALQMFVSAQTLDCVVGGELRPQVDVIQVGAATTFQWFLDDQPVVGETSPALRLTQEMFEKTASVRVTATLAPYFDTTVTSSTNCMILPAHVTPGTARLAGTPAVGSELTVEVAGWEPNPYVEYRYSWWVGDDWAGSSDRVILPASWVGRDVRVDVTGMGGAMETATVASAPVRVVPGPFPGAPAAQLKGVFAVGWIVSAESPAWTPQAKLSWQWRRVSPSGADAAISGATKSWYRLTAADEGARVYAVATGKAAGHVPTSVASSMSKPVAYNVYTTPGQRTVNGRQWRTTCEPYSRTTRCRTEIWATQVAYENQRFVKTTGWVFNNLTYLPSPRALWDGNNLGTKANWWSEGRHWMTRCDDTTTGKDACRSYIWTDFISSTRGSDGAWSYRRDAGWVFNNQVFFS